MKEQPRCMENVSLLPQGSVHSVTWPSLKEEGVEVKSKRRG